METDELEMCKEDLQKWISERVKKRLVSDGVLEKYKFLQTLLKRREEQLTHLLTLCSSVAALEASVKEQYSLLGWEYSGEDSCDDTSDKIYDCISRYADIILKNSNFDAAGDQTTQDLGDTRLNPASSTSTPPPQRDRSLHKRFPVVVLKKLPDCKIKPVPPPSSQSDHSGDAFLSDDNSDTFWGPEDDTSDSDYSIESYSSASKKRKRKEIWSTVPKKKLRKPQEKTTTNAKGDTKLPHKASRDSSAKDGGEKRPASQLAGAKANAESTAKPPPQVISDSDSEVSAASQSSSAKSSTKSPAQVSSDRKVKDKGEKSTAQSAGNKCDTKSQTPVSTDSKAKDKGEESASAAAGNKTESSKDKMPSQQAKTNGASSSSVKTLSQSSVGAKNTPQSSSAVPLSVDMEVLARHKALKWVKGKIIEIISTEEKLRYKVSFEKGKKIVSGHHIALLSSPKVNELDIGSRVVIQRSTDPLLYCPGIMAEIPSRKNRSRFLIIADDHIPSYCNMRQFHQVYKPLNDPLDDIADGTHKEFMRDYIKSWPFPAQTSYRIGQTLHAEYEGVQQKCEVLDVDCSLIKVVFEKDQHKEFIYRGSLRLEHMISMRKMQAKMDQK